MRGCGIADAVDRFEGGVDCGVEPDRVIGAKDVVIDRAGDADTDHAGLFLQRRQSAKGAVSADGDECLDLCRPQLFRRAPPTFGGLELFRA